MANLGFKVCGIEPNQGYGEFSIREYGLEVKLEPLEVVDFSCGMFDIITAIHSMEHVRDPLATLRRMRRWLNPKGILLIEVPNIEAHYHSPRTKFHFAHLFNFSVETLKKIGLRAGFKPISTILIPGVHHINIAFIPSNEEISIQSAKDKNHYEYIRKSLRAHTKLKHVFSTYPYTRFFTNLMRPIRERISLRNKISPKQILDDLFEDIMSFVKSNCSFYL